MWKDFFYYSKSERRSILALISIGILLLFFGTWTNFHRVPSITLVDSLSIDSFCITTYKRRHSSDSLYQTYGRKSYGVAAHLSSFDPNTVDSVGLCNLGLPPYLAKRIINYRKKGGVFRKAEDFSRIYGLTHQQYEKLLPYIVIDEKLRNGKVDSYKLAHDVTNSDRYTESPHHRHDSLGMGVKHSYPSLVKYPEGTIIDLNKADTTQLKQVPGIGSSIAKIIVTYRNRLGGYSQVEQLQEISYLDTTINKWFIIESPIYRPLRVNRASLDQLRNHPYMNFYKARAILEYRRKRGKIKGLSQLSMFQEFTEKDLVKLQPYLSFE